jgi:hypothetical protein
MHTFLLHFQGILQLCLLLTSNLISVVVKEAAELRPFGF